MVQRFPSRIHAAKINGISYTNRTILTLKRRRLLKNQNKSNDFRNGEFMTTKEQVLQFLEIHQWIPVENSPYATLASKRRIRKDRMCLNKLPSQKLASIARYIEMV